MSQSMEFDLTLSQAAEFDLTSPVFKANPYSIFARLRAYDPVYQYASLNGQSTWLITRYTDAEFVLRDERFVKDNQNALPSEERTPSCATPPSVDDLFSLSMLRFDPPNHTRLRKFVNLSFTLPQMERWRGRIEGITNELIDTVEGKGSMDLIEEFAFPLPIKIISDMLGAPARDSKKLQMWTKQIADALDDPDAFQQVGEDLQAFYTYLLALIERKRLYPADDLISKLLQTETEDDRLSERELVAMVFLLILAGYETTANLIGNGMLALLTHPEQMQLLKNHPALIKTAVEEFLRYTTPFTITTHRWAREDVELGGKLIRCGDEVIVSLSSSNRDEGKFSTADSLDITRQDNPHLAFGKGIHYCLGAQLARLEGQIAIGTLLHRLPNLRLQVDPTTLAWRPGSTVLGVKHLPVIF